MRTIHVLGWTVFALVFGSSAVFAQSSTETYTYDSLGRLVVADTSGGQNDDEAHSICYDKSGNRKEYKSTSDGSTSSCVDEGTSAGSSGSSSAPLPPSSPPPPVNSSPLTTADFDSGDCLTNSTVNLTGNDTDPELNYPLALTAISLGNGGMATASVLSSSSVSVTLGPSGDLTTFTYTVADSLGATATGQLSVSTTSCGGGEIPL